MTFIGKDENGNINAVSLRGKNLDGEVVGESNVDYFYRNSNTILKFPSKENAICILNRKLFGYDLNNKIDSRVYSGFGSFCCDNFFYLTHADSTGKFADNITIYENHTGKLSLGNVIDNHNLTTASTTPIVLGLKRKVLYAYRTLFLRLCSKDAVKTDAPDISLEKNDINLDGDFTIFIKYDRKGEPAETSNTTNANDYIFAVSTKNHSFMDMSSTNYKQHLDNHCLKVSFSNTSNGNRCYCVYLGSKEIYKSSNTNSDSGTYSYDNALALVYKSDTKELFLLNKHNAYFQGGYLETYLDPKYKIYTGDLTTSSSGNLIADFSLFRNETNGSGFTNGYGLKAFYVFKDKALTPNELCILYNFES